FAIPQRWQHDVLDPMAEIGGVEQREFLGTERVYALAAFDNRFDQLLRIPLGRDDVIALGNQPGLEQFALRGLAGPVGSFEGDEESTSAAGTRKMVDDAFLERAVGRMRFVSHDA